MRQFLVFALFVVTLGCVGYVGIHDRNAYVMSDGHGVAKRAEGELDDQGWAKHEELYPGECVFELLPDGEVLTPTEQPREPPMHAARHG